MELVITKDNGEIETFNAYRVQHDNSRGPYKGGLRYHPQVDLDDVRRCIGVFSVKTFSAFWHQVSRRLQRPVQFNVQYWHSCAGNI